MSYGVHLAKDDGSGYFSYTGFTFQPKYTIHVEKPKAGVFSMKIPPAPPGFTYHIVGFDNPSMIGAGGLGGTDYYPKTDVLEGFEFPKASSIGQVVEDIKITNDGTVTYTGGGGFIPGVGGAYYISYSVFLVYLRGS